MIDDDVVQQSGSREQSEIRTLDKVVLQIRVLRADNPTSIERVARGIRLLEDIGGDANARLLASRHPESQVGALEIELV